MTDVKLSKWQRWRRNTELDPVRRSKYLAKRREHAHRRRLRYADKFNAKRRARHRKKIHDRWIAELRAEGHIITPPVSVVEIAALPSAQVDQIVLDAVARKEQAVEDTTREPCPDGTPIPF